MLIRAESQHQPDIGLQQTDSKLKISENNTVTVEVKKLGKQLKLFID